MNSKSITLFDVLLNKNYPRAKVLEHVRMKVFNLINKDKHNNLLQDAWFLPTQNFSPFCINSFVIFLTIMTNKLTGRFYTVYLHI
jgi:hypothetical protein